MRIELDISRVKKSVEKMRKAEQVLQETNQKLTNKFITQATENLNYIARTAIDKFYEDYEPHWYNRTYDLYNMYRVKVTEDEWSVDFDSTWSETWHRVDAQDPEYIFENSLVRGWHGGAISGEGHPNPGTPYWRLPDDFLPLDEDWILPLFSQSSPWVFALRSPSPYEEIVRKSNVYMRLETAKYYQTYNDNIDKFYRSAKYHLERIK